MKVRTFYDLDADFQEKLLQFGPGPQPAEAETYRERAILIDKMARDSVPKMFVDQFRSLRAEGWRLYRKAVERDWISYWFWKP